MTDIVPILKQKFSLSISKYFKCNQSLDRTPDLIIYDPLLI